MKKISRRSFITAMAAVSAAGVSGRLRFFFQQHGFFCGFFRCIQRSNFLCRIYG